MDSSQQEKITKILENDYPWILIDQLPEISVKLDPHDLDDFPQDKIWRLPLLQRIDENDKNRIYTVWYDPYKKYVYTMYGTLEDRQMNRGHEIELGRQKTYQAQAYQEAVNYWRKAESKSNYTASETLSTLPTNLPIPMTGQPLSKFTGDAEKRHQKALDEYRNGKRAKPPKAPQFTIKRFPIVATLKEDGVRGLILYANNRVYIVSRNGKLYTSMPHIEAAFLKMYQTVLPHSFIVDGEIMIDEEPLQVISGLARQKTPNEDTARLNYKIFDLMLYDIPFEARYNLYMMILRNWYKTLPENSECISIPSRQNPIIVGLVARLLWSKEEIFEALDAAESLGKEGIVLRKLAGTCTDLSAVESMRERIQKCSLSDPTKLSWKSSLYVNKRAANFIKVKNFETDEGNLIELYQGNGEQRGMVVSMLLEKDGQQFKVTPLGDHEYRRELWSSWQTTVGRKKLQGMPVTYKYKDKTSDGIPRNANALVFRDYE